MLATHRMGDTRRLPSSGCSGQPRGRLCPAALARTTVHDPAGVHVLHGACRAARRLPHGPLRMSRFCFLKYCGGGDRHRQAQVTGLGGSL